MSGNVFILHLLLYGTLFGYEILADSFFLLTFKVLDCFLIKNQLVSHTVVSFLIGNMSFLRLLLRIFLSLTFLNVPMLVYIWIRFWWFFFFFFLDLVCFSTLKIIYTSNWKNLSRYLYVTFLPHSNFSWNFCCILSCIFLTYPHFFILLVLSSPIIPWVQSNQAALKLARARSLLSSILPRPRAALTFVFLGLSVTLATVGCSLV